MPRIALICAVVLGVMAVAASAEDDFDCEKAYKRFWDKQHSEPSAKRSPQRHAALSRKALRIYDACLTNDVYDAKALFDRLERWSE